MKKLFILSLYVFLFNRVAVAQTFITLVTINQGTDLSDNYIHQYINSKGQIIYTENQNQTINERIFEFNNGLGRIRRNNKYGFLNNNGEIAIPLIYESAEDFSDGLALVKINGCWGFINTKNEIVIKPTYKAGIRRFQNGFAIYKRDNKFGYLNKNGEEITQPLYDRVSYFKNNKAWVLINGKWGCINTKGEYIINPIYSDTQDFSEGYAWVKKDLIWGLVDSTNKYIILPNERNPLIYAHSATVKNFNKINNGLLFSKTNEKFGFCNISFNKIIPNKFDQVSDFENGKALVKIQGNWGVIDTLGNFIIEPKYENIKNLHHGFFAIKSNNSKWGIINESNKKITEYIYHSIFEFETPY